MTKEELKIKKKKVDKLCAESKKLFKGLPGTRKKFDEVNEKLYLVLTDKEEENK